MVLFSSRIAKQAKIGSNFRIAHPACIIIGGAKIGDNVTVWQNVTIGGSGRAVEVGRYPIIEDGVKIFANAVVVGNIRVGFGATVGALFYVNRNVPRGSTAIGIPAQFVKFPNEKTKEVISPSQ
jgi:serine O-acetyltransferase